MTPAEADDTVIEVWFEIEKDADGYPKSRDLEALLCKPLDAECSTCIVRSVPFYVQAVAFGDTIATVTPPDNENQLNFSKVLKRSGYSIYRILLNDSTEKDKVVEELFNFNTLIEIRGDYVAIAIGPNENVDALVDYILEGKKADRWGAQDGYIFEES